MIVHILSDMRRKSIEEMMLLDVVRLIVVDVVVGVAIPIAHYLAILVFKNIRENGAAINATTVWSTSRD